MIIRSSLRVARNVQRQNRLAAVSRWIPSRWLSQADARPPSPVHPQNNPPGPTMPFDENYAGPTKEALSVFGKLFRFFSYGILTLGVVSYTGYEGTHWWIEHMELAAHPSSPNDNQFGWDEERETWTGGSKGGTDKRLGWKARHAIRSAWAALNWGPGHDLNVNGLHAQLRLRSEESIKAGRLNMVDRGYEVALTFLNYALDLARANPSIETDGTVINDLLSRRAGVLERIGTRESLEDARVSYEKVLDSVVVSGTREQAGRLAVKIGDVCRRLGGGEEAVLWWSRAVDFVSSEGEVLESMSKQPTSPARQVDEATSRLMKSPSAQRTLASAFVSISAYYATTNQLDSAASIEYSALHFLSRIAPPLSLDRNMQKAPELLHTLYLQHRAALLQIHYAEVLHVLSELKDSKAKRRSSDPEAAQPSTSFDLLKTAWGTSERVLRSLTGLPLTTRDAQSKTNAKVGSRETWDLPPPPNVAVTSKEVRPVFLSSPNLRKPATNLLRDSRRAAVEALNLCGLLEEDSGNVENALEHLQRALTWVGGVESGEPAEGTPDQEWRAVWRNYVRIREKALKSPA
jgi:tetratricopeptide (TPR) repeat protein